MEAVPLYDYYSFGWNYSLLVRGTGEILYDDLVERIRQYSDLVDQLDLKVTKACLKRNGINDILNEITEKHNGDDKPSMVGEELHHKVVEIINNADTTLDSELSIKYGYILKDKRISNDILLNDISKLFAENIFLKLPPIAQFDFKEGGRCIAFGLYTASAFHALRGTEDVLKLYYSKLLSKVPTEKQTWGNFYTEIDNAITAGTLMPQPSPELMNNLDNLRKYYRNKTQHPQMIYNADEAQDLFFHCIKTINQMIGDLLLRSLI